MGKLNLLTIKEITCTDKFGNVLWRKDKELYNVVHSEGEQYILTAAFNPGSIVPDNFYFGLDARSSVVVADTMAEISGEPSTNGYSRQAVSSDGEFDIQLGGGGYYGAEGSTVGFSASGGNWGPVTNIFLTTESDATGYLIASVPLDDPLTVTDGITINMRMSVALRNS